MISRILSAFFIIFCACFLQNTCVGLPNGEIGKPSTTEDTSVSDTPDEYDELYGNQFKPMSGIAGNIGLNNAGFTATIQYVRLFTPDRIGFLNLSFLGAGDENERKTFDIYTGQTVSLNRINSMMILPVTVGLQQRLFSSEIESTFRPFAEIGIGPSFGYITNYDDGFFKGFSKGRAAWGMNGVVGLGAYFGSSPTAIQGIIFRYQLNYFTKSIELVEQNPRNYFGTISINLIFGTFFK